MSDNVVSGGDSLTIPVLLPQGPQTLDYLARIATAVEKVGTDTAKASKDTETASQSWSDSLKTVAEKYTYIEGAVTSLASKLSALVSHITESATAGERLTRASQTLGVDFGAAADQAGGYVSELEVMSAAQQFAARDIRLTQGEVNALSRVAQDYARTTGREFREVVQQLGESVAKGGEELGRFGGQLAPLAQGSHTAEERLRALVARAHDIQPAASTASDSIEALRGAIADADRTFSTAFVEGLARFSQVGSAAGDARDKVRDLREDIRLAGDFAAQAVVRIGNGFAAVVGFLGVGVQSVLTSIGAVGAALEAIASGNVRGAGSAAASYFRESATSGRLADLVAFMRGRVDAVNAAAEMGPAAPANDNAHGGADMVFSADLISAAERDRAARDRRGGGGGGSSDRRTRLERLLDRAISGPDAAQRDRSRGVTLRGELEGIFTGTGEITAPELDMSTSKGGQLGGERQVGTTADQRFSDAAKERTEQRARDRERRGFEDRLEAARSFTDRWEELHHRQVNATAEAASAMDSALGGLGTALSKHFEAIVAGQETVGAALKGILTDTLDSIAKESFTKGGFYAAEAIAKLVMYDYPGAATAAAASAAYFAAGATATGLGALVSSGSQPQAPSAAAGGSAPRSERTGGAANDNAGGGGEVIVNHFYAPVIGGRTATDAEVGSRMDRYTDATARRQVRARA